MNSNAAKDWNLGQSDGGHDFAEKGVTSTAVAWTGFMGGRAALSARLDP
jgi:hypothetical protein